MSSVSSTILRGHKDSVESVYQSEIGSLFSSSCDGTVRMWDVRVKNSSIRLFKIPSEIDGDVGLCKDSNSLLCVSRGSSLFGYDLRFSSSIIVPVPDFSFSNLDSEDDINDFIFDGRDSVLVPSDSGRITVLDIPTFTSTSCMLLHDNIASVVRPLPSQYVSGGYDCNLVTVPSDAKSEVSKRVFPISTLLPQEESTPGQTLNPPFVTALEYSSQQTQLAVGAGDGSVVVLDVRKGKVNWRQTAWGGSSIHSAATAAIAWDEDSVWSVGNDCVLMRMNETRISVRMVLESKPNSVALVQNGSVAVAGISNDISVYRFV